MKRPRLWTASLLFAALVGLLLTLITFQLRDVLRETFTQFDGVALEAVTAGIAERGIWGRLTDNLLFAGPIPYAILCVFFVSVAYFVLVTVRGTVPRALMVRSELASLTGNGDAQWEDILDRVNRLPTQSVVRLRFQALARAFESSQSADKTQQENDRAATEAETETSYQLLPLVYGEWMLPVLGFVGTVWGVILATSDLRVGITTLFRTKGITTSVLESFNRGFDGLGVSFFTTLFGLIGLAIVGTATFFLRRGAVRALVDLDGTCRSMIHALGERDVERLLREGLFVTDKQGELQMGDDEKPQLRLAHWFEELRAALLVLDKDGKAQLKEGAPVLRSDEWREMMRQGLFVTNDEGGMQYGKDQKPIARWQSFLDLLQQEMFAPGPNGEPVSRWAHWRSQVLLVLVREFLEVTEDEAERIVDAIASGPDGETDIMLRSRAERRFRQLVGELRVVELLIQQQGGAAAGDDKSGSPATPGLPLLGHRVLPPAGTPVLCATIELGRFAIARETGADTREFALFTGEVQEKLQGQFLLPQLDEHHKIVPEAPQGLAIDGGLVACSFVPSNSVQTFRLTPGQAPNITFFAAGELGDSIVMLKREKTPHAVVLLDVGKRHELRARPLDGSAPPDHTVIWGEVPGGKLTVARWNNRAIATASRNGNSSQVSVLMAEQQLAVHEVDDDVRSMAFSPTGSLWLLTTDAKLVEFDLRLHTPDAKQRRNLHVEADALAVTAAFEVVCAKLGERDLWFASHEQQSAPVRLRYDSPITCLATSADGSCTLVGLQDGSAYFHDTRRTVCQARED